EEHELPELRVDLPDPGDLHVVRAAKAVEGAIVTFNGSDFPAVLLQPLGVAALTPDAALAEIARDDERGLSDAVDRIVSRLRSPPVGLPEYAAGFAKAGCPRFARWIVEKRIQS